MKLVGQLVCAWFTIQILLGVILFASLGGCTASYQPNCLENCGGGDLNSSHSLN